ncbi:EAL domain-containing protein [Vibrio vulnificus]|uniref:bifunctional diguanylate cyclase/phosphodiesterase n=1 Tax=Vibrio vulnificus TaxID=672 RepID=UPI0010296951|nr:EAL domain-containing protein [Vibrio vulnificus]EHU9443948.1 EAL domain-containing protein [Vibrio vulnificus]RZP99946.1 EAL domain-containing protein [Vibrio vulnificus]
MSRFRLLHLTLRSRTALYFGLGLIGVILSTLFITRTFFLYSLDELENLEVSRANKQAQAVIEMMISLQEDRSYDWAYWDETYQLFTEGDIAGYRDRNLYQESLDTLSLDMMAFVSLKGEVVESLVRAQGDSTYNPLVSQIVANDSVKSHFTKMNSMLDLYRESEAGLLLIDEQLWVISLTPVRDSEGVSAASGWLIWGQNLSERFPGNFDAILTADNKLLGLNQLQLPSESVQLSENTWVHRDKETVVEWSTVYGMLGEQVAYLQTTELRVHYLKGHRLFLYLIGIVVLVAGLIALATFMLFKKRVSTRFADFEQSVMQLFSKYQLDDLSNRRTDELERITQLVEVLAENTSLTQDKLQDTLQKFDALYQHRSMGMLLVVDKEIIDINQAALELLGYQKGDLVHQELNVLCKVDENQPECKVDQMYQALSNGVTQFEATMITRQGREIECLIDVNLIHHENQQALMLSVSDMSEQKKQARMIKDLVGRDPVSGLYNRPAILARLDDLIQHQPNQFSFLYISIDRLKQVSEVYGHLIFDDTISYIAAVFGAELRPFEVGRVSEFEFIAIIEDVEQCDDAIQCATHFMDVLSRKTHILGIELDLSCQIAIADPEITHHSLGYLLQSGSFAVQRFQHKVVTEVIQIGEDVAKRAQSALVISRDISQAIRDKAIIAHYQPIVDTESGKINGFEALARWIHPELGFVPPDVFIDLAEQHQLIVELGESILRQACQFISKLNRTRADNGLNPLTVHVNLSAMHFYHARLPDALRHVMDEFDIAPGQLVIEITESTLLGIESETLERTKEIKSLGIQLALDDFGTGYSSFSTLCSFPLDIVKLDKSYIDQLENNDRARTLIRSIASMAKELGLTTVAEGVETASQLRKLKIWHVDEIQGYYFYKPMPESEALNAFERQ